jgi:nucleoside-diphosphate-sugar epimerase
MSKQRIALLGATSHIAKCLIKNFIAAGDTSLVLFTRRAEPVQAFLREIGLEEHTNLLVCEGYDAFSEHAYDAIINCIGLGTVSHESHIYTSFFMVTEQFDNLIISYLLKSPRTRFINFSSGAIYGRTFPEPAQEQTMNAIRVNALTRDDSFTIAKLNSEAKHRAFEQLNIIDIRVFSYFSRFVDIAGKYFITELFHALVHDTVFHTSGENIVRDYIHPEDLFALIVLCLNLDKTNAAFDAYSLEPVAKLDVLKSFSSHYNLKVKTENEKEYHTVTGQKRVYYSAYKKAEEIGYRPRYSSMNTLCMEGELLLQRQTAQKTARTGS